QPGLHHQHAPQMAIPIAMSGHVFAPLAQDGFGLEPAFLAQARQSPGKLSFGSGSSSSRIAGELLQQMAGVQLLHVPYKSNPLAVTDLLGGQIDMMITDTATGLPQVKSGKLRALGVTGQARSPLAPDVPTIAESGVPGYEMGYWFAAYAPAGTPPDVVKRLNELLVKATQSAPAKQFYAQTGTDPASSTPDELAQFQQAESKKWGDIIKKAGIQPE
ncbi:Bug family tripartite tricarboxylate transporter substrate binding protein, partial [Achromobacter ruhlandii]|uniref:Bug family tripartite tricarboxylate transporter substrate binding protein n=1 Tax=Achromobacter ruhlandii TaxID=72557 RepID=UPI0020168F43